jgi:uracil-DNA glycosylase family 4
MKCNLCEGSKIFHYGLKGSNSDNTGLLWVLNKPDLRVNNLWEGDERYRIALHGTNTGRVVEEALQFCGLSYEDIYLTNVFKCVLKEDRKPSRDDRRRCLDSFFQIQLSLFNPSEMVAFGAHVFETLFPKLVTKSRKHQDYIGTVQDYQGIPILVANHPSWIWSLNPMRATGKGSTEAQREHYQMIKEFTEEFRRDRT